MSPKAHGKSATEDDDMRLTFDRALVERLIASKKIARLKPLFKPEEALLTASGMRRLIAAMDHSRFNQVSLADAAGP